MWKWIFSGALATLLTAIVGFGTRVFLSYEVSKSTLVIYYAIIDAVFYVVIFLSAYKDPFVTLYSSGCIKQIVRNVYGLGYLLSMVLCSLFILPSLYFFYLSEKLDINLAFLWGILICFILIGTSLYILPYFTAARVYRVIVIKDLFKAVSLLACVITWIAFWGDSQYNQSMGLMLCFILSESILIVWLVWSLWSHQISIKIDLTIRSYTSDVRDFFKNYGLTLLTYIFSYLSTLGVPLIMLSYYESDDVADFLVVARPIYSSLISIFSFAVFRFMFPEMTHLIAKSKFVEILNIRKKFRFGVMAFGLMAASGCWLFSEWIILMIFPTEYVGSYQMVNILIIGLPFAVYSSFSLSIIKGGKQYKKVLFIRIMGACTFVLLFLGISLADLAIVYTPLAIVGDVVVTCLVCIISEHKVLGMLSTNAQVRS